MTFLPVPDLAPRSVSVQRMLTTCWADARSGHCWEQATTDIGLCDDHYQRLRDTGTALSTLETKSLNERTHDAHHACA